MQTVLDQIRIQLPQMGKKQRQVAEWVANNPAQACYQPANRIAEEFGISHATVIRLARQLGYPGFPEFQDALAELVHRRLSTTERLERVRDTPMGDFLVKTFERNLSNTRTTAQRLSPERFQEAVELLKNARRVFVVGHASAAGMATSFTYNLGLMKPDVRQVAGGGVSTQFQQVLDASPGDLVVAFSFPRYNRMTTQVVEYAREQGASVLLVTDTVAAPEAAHATVVLTATVESTHFNNSWGAVFALIDALVGGLALAGHPDTSERLQKWESVVSRYAFNARANRQAPGEKE